MSELVWKRRCDTGSCVEVAFDGDKVLVRDSKRDDSPALEYTRDEWRERVLIDGPPADAWQPFSDDDWCWGREDHDPDEWLRFTDAEMGAFVAGVRGGEFDHAG